MNFPKFTWIYLNLPDFTWTYLNLHELTWTYLNLPDTPELTWIEGYEEIGCWIWDLSQTYIHTHTHTDRGFLGCLEILSDLIMSQPQTARSTNSIRWNISNGINQSDTSHLLFPPQSRMEYLKSDTSLHSQWWIWPEYPACWLSSEIIDSIHLE